MREKWLDRTRGIAIIAVITQHLMGIAHHTEVIQVTTLFCTSVLIICMGITQCWGYDKAITNGQIAKNGDIVKYLFQRMLPILCALCVGTMAYMTYNREWAGVEFAYLLTRVISCDAALPFYFFRHYINLTLLSPVLYYIVSVIRGIENNWWRMICNAFLLIVCFLTGYLLIGRFELLSESYLSLYVLGMIWGG